MKKNIPLKFTFFLLGSFLFILHASYVKSGQTDFPEVELKTFSNSENSHLNTLRIYDINKAPTSHLLQAILLDTFESNQLPNSAPQTLENLLQFSPNFILLPIALEHESRKVLPQTAAGKKALNKVQLLCQISCLNVLEKDYQQKLGNVQKRQSELLKKLKDLKQQ